MAEERKTEGGGARKRNTAARDAQGVRKQTYRRFKEGEDFEPVDSAQTSALCDMMRRGIFGEEDAEGGERVRHPGGRPRKIETVEELREGIERYINYIDDNARAGVPLIPDVEGLALFLGISRSTLFEWQRSRPGEFADTIKTALNAIAAYKKQLALTGKIPQVVFATDFNNNHGYTQTQKIELDAPRRLDELPDKKDIVKRLPVASGGGDIDSEPDIDL